MIQPALARRRHGAPERAGWSVASSFLLAALLLPSFLAFPGARAQETARQSAPVVIANRVIVMLRGPIAGYTAEERAKSSIERIERALRTNPDPSITLEDHQAGTRVSVGGAHAFLITKVDIDEQAGETTGIVAEEAARRLRTAVGEWREQTTPRYLLTAVTLAAAATLLFGALAWALFRGFGWLGGRVAAGVEARARKVHMINVGRIGQRLIALVGWLLAIALTSAWITFVLEQFPYTRAWGENLEENLTGIVKQVAVAIVAALPGLLVVAIVFVLARVLIGLARPFFDRVEAGRARVRWLDPDMVRPTRRISTLVIWIFALALAFPFLPGAQTDAFKGLSVLVGLMISLGGASVIGQAFSGLILMYTRVFRRGDYVRIGDAEGTVVDLGMFQTRIRTGLGEEISMSNANVMAATTTNYSRAVPGTGYVVDTAVTIGYATPWRQVHAMLEEAARRTDDIAEQPAPFVRQTALSDFYVEYRLVAYTPVERPVARVDVLNRLHGNIQDVFNEHEVQIMSPHYMIDPPTPQIVPKERWYTPPTRPASSE
jgi:small-conductance mechanosensitive channel